MEHRSSDMKSLTTDDQACPIDYPGFVFRTLCNDGYKADTLLAGTGLTEEHFTDSNIRIEYATLRRFILNAIQTTGDAHLGPRLAKRFDVRFIGLPAYAATNAASFEGALEVLNRFFSLTFTAIEFTFPDDDAELEHGEEAIRLRTTLPFEDIAYFVVGSALVGCDGLCKAILERDQVAVRAETTVDEPEGWADIAPHLGFPIRFGAPENRLIFPTALLGRPLPGADPINHPRLVALCEERVRDQAFETTLVCQVLSFLERDQNIDASLSEAAAALGYSERGLRRHLERSGTSFRRLVGEVRERRAREMLANSAQPIQSIAYDLGFDAPSNFARSFKRWTGLTPKAFREQALARDDAGRK